MLSKALKDYFKGKQITVMGLGLLGRGIGDVIFLAKAGAKLTVTDLKTKEELAPALKELKAKLGEVEYKKIKFVLGEHRLTDFKQCDFILKAGGVPLNSPYIVEAKKNKIPVKMDEAWLAELSDARIVGITGTKGKSTITQLTYEILQAAAKGKKYKVYLAGNMKGFSALPLLTKLKPEDIVVMELDSWRLQGFGEAGISPEISVFANFMLDHQNYYAGNMNIYFADKANIFNHQSEGHLLIAGKEVVKLIKQKGIKIGSQIIIPEAADVPKSWKLKILGEHNRFNVACALAVARVLGVPDKISRAVVEGFVGLPGRLEFVHEVDGIKFYNDTNATTTEGVIMSLRALSPRTTLGQGNPRVVLGRTKRGIVLIGGGADKKLDYADYIKELAKTPIKALILFKGAATDKIISLLPATSKFPVFVAESMPLALGLAVSHAERGDIVLLSPGASSFGIFVNEYDRGEQFVAGVKKLK